jgi:hypothetical protein
MMNNISFEITLTIVVVSMTVLIPISAQSSSVPSELVPSVQDYLQIASATVTNQTGGQLMNAQISTIGDIPAAADKENGDESGSGFGYGILSTGPSNMIVAITDLGLEKEETIVESGEAIDIEETVGDGEENVVSSNGLELHFVEMTPMVSQQCVGKGDYEVKINATEQNPRFNPGYSLQVEGGSITVENIKATDLGSDIDSVVSFTMVPVYDKTEVIGGGEGDGGDDEDDDDQPSNICIHVIGRAGIT